MNPLPSLFLFFCMRLTQWSFFWCSAKPQTTLDRNSPLRSVSHVKVDVNREKLKTPFAATFTIEIVCPRTVLFISS
jgi:hypothetical protein